MMVASSVDGEDSSLSESSESSSGASAVFVGVGFVVVRKRGWVAAAAGRKKKTNTTRKRTHQGANRPAHKQFTPNFGHDLVHLGGRALGGGPGGGSVVGGGGGRVGR
jgi:hypothetical protein